MRRAWVVAAAALAFGCALFATWPAASSPTDTILCNFVHPDCVSNHWLMVWVADQVAHGRSILHNDAYYWPVGDAPWLAGNGSEGFGYLPFHLLFGWPTGSTIYLVGILTLNGLAGYTLARAAGASPAAALAAAPTASAMLYAIHELGAGRFSQVSFCWMAFFLAAWLRFLRAPASSPSVLGGVGAAALLAVTSLFYWYYGLFSVLAGGTLLLFHLRRNDRPPIRALVVFAVSYLVLIGLLLWVFARYWAAIPGTAEDVFPHPESVGDSTFPGIPFLVNSGRHAGRALPFSTCVLAIAALFDRERRRLVLAWWAVALLFAGLMAGSLIPHGPYELIYGLAGPLRRFWWPYRHVVVLNLALTVLAALGAERWLKRPWLLFALAVSIPVQLTLQGAPWHAQFSKAEMEKGEFYAKLADAPGDVLLEPPLAPQVASAQTPLAYQLLHHKKLLAGHALWVERVRPDAWDEFVAANSLLSEMQRLERGELDTTFTVSGPDVTALKDRGVRVIVLNQEYFPLVLKPLTQSYDAVLTGLFGPPIAKGTRVKAWDLGNWTGATTVEFPKFTWPGDLRYGGPTLALQAPRPPSVIFSIPGPPREK
jgi:hypothetical protein